MISNVNDLIIIKLENIDRLAFISFKILSLSTSNLFTKLVLSTYRKSVDGIKCDKIRNQSFKREHRIGTLEKH